MTAVDLHHHPTERLLLSSPSMFLSPTLLRYESRPPAAIASPMCLAQSDPVLGELLANMTDAEIEVFLSIQSKHLFHHRNGFPARRLSNSLVMQAIESVLQLRLTHPLRVPLAHPECIHRLDPIDLS